MLTVSSQIDDELDHTAVSKNSIGRLMLQSIPDALATNVIGVLKILGAEFSRTLEFVTHVSGRRVKKSMKKIAESRRAKWLLFQERSLLALHEGPSDHAVEFCVLFSSQASFLV